MQINVIGTTATVIARTQAQAQGCLDLEILLLLLHVYFFGHKMIETMHKSVSPRTAISLDNNVDHIVIGKILCISSTADTRVSGQCFAHIRAVLCMHHRRLQICLWYPHFRCLDLRIRLHESEARF